MGLFDFITEPVASLAGSALQAVGGLLGNESSAREAQLSRDQSVDIAQHRHQWEVADLKAAGLNPILSANSGASVSSLPTGSQVNPFLGIGDSFNSARKIDEVDKRALQIQRDAQESQSNLNDATASLRDAETSKAASEKNLADEQAALTRMTSVNKIMERDNITTQQAAIAAQAQRDYSQAQLNSASEVATRALQNKTASQTELNQRELRTGKYDEKVETYTRPVRNVIETLTSPIRGIFHKSSNTNRLE